MKSKGFTLIELMIVLAICGILFAVIYPAIKGSKASSKRPATADQFEQAKRERDVFVCKDNLRFVRDNNGDVKQVFDQNGRGVFCTDPQ